MNQPQLEKIALVIAIAGLLFLYVIANDITPNVLPETAPDLSKSTTLNGIVTEIHTSQKAIFLTVDAQRTDQTKVIIFSDEPLNIKNGDHVEIQGTTQTQNGEEEVIASNVKLK